MNKVPVIVQVIIAYDGLLSRYAQCLTGNECIGKKVVKDVFEAWYELPDALKQGNTKEQLRRLTFALCQAYVQENNNNASLETSCHD